nr:MAG: ORF1 [Torque teno midi virus]
MPFWWRRRNKRWYGRGYKRRYPARRRYKRRRFTYKKRRHRRATRRSRRRRKKVRRKKPTLLVRQWQPDSIVLCKIKGFDSIIWGSEGTQYLCCTSQLTEFTRSKYPGGGVFAVQLYSLQWLYDQWRLKNNIWTKTNLYKDLCRYLKVIFRFYRHRNVDFVVWYNRQPPFHIDKLTYMQFHPYMLLQRKNKIIIPSLATNPKGKPFKKKTIKPPKQMLSKWFFQQQFTHYDLLQIGASACSLSYPRISCCDENRMLTFFCLNPKFFSDTNWAQTPTGDNYYMPYALIPDLTFVSGPQNRPIEYKPKSEYIEKRPTVETELGRYYRSIDLTGGYFSPRVLGAWKVKIGTVENKPLPIVLARYNPAIDDGKGNKVWLATNITGHYNIPDKTPDFIIENQPLWLAFWGYYDFLKDSKGEGIFPVHFFVVKSPYIQTQQTEATEPFYCFIDPQIIQGKNQYDSPITYTEKHLWYPTVYWQTKTINAICSSGPYVPKLNNQTQSTWELATKYSFHFKWGGPQITDQPVDDPSRKNKYDVPDTIKEAVQVYDPAKNIAATMFHDWDYRRGCITGPAIKRMQENLPTDSSLESDTEQEPKAKKRRVVPTLHNPLKETEKIQACLLSLCEESTCQETQKEKSLHQLILQQQQQQQQLKHNLLTLIKDIKVKQRLLQLQTGVLE